MSAPAVGDEVRLDALRGGSEPWTAVIAAIDELADLAVISTAVALPGQVSGLRESDRTRLGTEVTVVGHAVVPDPGHSYEYLDARGEWAGGTTRDGVPLGRVTSTDVMKGMSGAPVCRVGDGMVVGLVSGRYNSADGWLAGSVWVARCERLAELCEGLAPLEINRSAAVAPLEVTLRIEDREASLIVDGTEVRERHGGVGFGLVHALDEVRRARARAGGTRTLSAVREIGPVGLRGIGRLLGEAFLPGVVGRELVHVLEGAERGTQQVRLAIQADATSLRLPWEALPDPRSGEPLVLHPLTCVYRKATGVVAAPMPHPLRILIAISSPERGGGALLDYERELRNVLAAVRAARQGDAHVRIVPFATTAAIRAELERDSVHVLHLSGHGGPGLFVLEDESGGARELDSATFVAEAIPPGGMPVVVALAACHTNVATAGGDPSFAGGLLARGASVVIASETSVTDVYTTRVFARTYERLAGSWSGDPVRAVSDARRIVQTELQGSNDERDRQLGELDEWGVLSVLSSSGAVEIIDRDRHRPPPPPQARFAIGGVGERRVGDFVGRRSEQRRWPVELIAGERAGMVLHGIGGVGKTTLAAELISRIADHEPSRKACLLVGEVTIEALLGGLTATLRQAALMSDLLRGAIAQALSIGARSDLPWQDRVATLRQHVLGTIPVLIVLDNFEDNLAKDQAGERTVRDSTLGGALAALIADPALARVLITCRYRFTLPDDVHGRLRFESLPALTAAETQKLIWSLPALDRLLPEEIDSVWRLVGGHPRSLEYLDALLSHGAGRYPDIAQRLTAGLTRRLGATDAATVLDASWQLDDALAEVATITSDEILLTDLLAGLTDGARHLLIGISVYRQPVDVNAALYQAGAADQHASNVPDHRAIREILETAGIDVSEEIDLETLTPEVRAQIEPHMVTSPTPPRSSPPMLADIIDRCAASSLLTVTGTGRETELFVHRWTAAKLADQTPDVELRAAHRAAAEYWQWRVSVWPQGREADMHDLLEARHHLLAAGDLEPASQITERVVLQLQQEGAWDDASALVRDMLGRRPPDHPRIGGDLHQLGILAYMRGEFAEAEQLYRRALEIFERFDDQSGTARSYGQLGTLARARGELAEAEKLYRRVREIFERLDDQSGIATTDHQLGIMAQDRGQLAEAEQLYRRAFKLREQLGDESGMATTGHQLGMLAQMRGEVEEAKQLFCRSLEIQKRLGDQPGMARGYGQLGTLAHMLGELEEAERRYRQAVEIFERLGDQSGMALTGHQLGIIAHDRGALMEAEQLYRRAFEIFERLGDQPRMAGSYHQLGILAQERGDLAEADLLYRRSIEITERLGDQSKMARTLHQLAALAQERGDLAEAEQLHRHVLQIFEHLGDQAAIASSYHQLGLLAQEKGELREADRLYRQSCEINERLGDQPGMARSYGQLGMLALDQGHLAEAEQLYRRALATFQRLGDQARMGACISQLAVVHAKRGELSTAAAFHARSLSLCITADPRMAGFALNRLAELNREIGDQATLEALRTAFGDEDAVNILGLIADDSASGDAQSTE